jgi:hypothetical protein
VLRLGSECVEVAAMTDGIDTTAAAPVFASPPTIDERVSSWIRGRGDWFNSDHRRRLRDQWRDVAYRYGAESGPGTGCLLALVRAAWDDRYAHAEPNEDGEWCVWLPATGSASGHVASEALALVVALEAAPCLPF